MITSSLLLATLMLAPGPKAPVLDLRRLPQGVPANPLVYGMNTAWWAGKDWSLHADQVSKAKEAGISLWRFPGGSASDEYVWNRNFQRYPTRIPGILDSWTLDSDSFGQMLQSKGAQGIVTVNYGLARQQGVELAAELAAEWVRELNVRRKLGIKYWEIGNEVFAEWEAGFKVGETVTTGELYGHHFRIFAQKMKAVDPTILVGACGVPEDAKGTYKNGGFDFWMRRMLPEIKDTADFLIIHEYFKWPYDEQEKFIPQTPEECLARIPRIAEVRRMTDRAAKKYAGRTFPIALTEFNILLGNSGPTVEFTNTVFTSLALAELQQHGYLLANYWDWKNGWDNQPAEKGGQGEHGLIASGENAPMPVDTPYAPFAAYLLHQRFLADDVIRLKAPAKGVQAFASRRAGKLASIMLVNQGKTPVILDLRTSEPLQTRTYTAEGIPSGTFTTRRVRWNGVAGPRGGGVVWPLPKDPAWTPQLEPVRVPGPGVVVVQLRSSQ